ncbi:Sialic acid TRAP transporter permease protein SiaT [Marinomonas spartinae]|uniref:TRAP transporter large permease protein n=1 Tax=Marinomonas spartinae TaxID=1792290 RepID=A0A1A8TI25_9GAMM|nr:TRAP transporter large permease subunit [Marinomonas spartinae]SBS32042.1 Sialic acid TRAP transporter permease protein SiaT [Marinomonas spartinae]SBS35593.1 Sialic acid TRAP transporter permease protein SiaT [Marinomonas spartinae]
MTFTITICALAILMILGLPISVSLLISGMLGYMITIGVGPGINALTQTAYSDLNSFVIIAIPLYIYMGQLMLKGGAGKDLFSFAHRITRKLPGGLAIAATLASTIFAAISGSSTATAATIGSISIPEMRERGYPKRLSAGCVAVSGTLGILIPPSISFILYSLVTNTSVNKLFLAGIIPGLMLAGLFSVYSIYAMRKKAVKDVNDGQAEETKAPITFDMIASLLLIPVVLGGIYTGLFTPTEAAGVGVIYALLLTIFLKRSLSLKLFWQATMSSVETSAMILMLIAGASVFGNTLSLLQVPQDVAQWIDSLNLSAIQFLILINILYLILGMFMDAAAAILVTVPILLPALQALDINLVWFGVILVINMEIGAVTPPVGMNLFVVKAICEDFTIKDVLVGAFPYAMMGLLGLVLIMVFPDIAMYLPNLSPN